MSDLTTGNLINSFLYSPPAAPWRAVWGTVSRAEPALIVRLDGEEDVVPATSIAPGAYAAGDRVWCLLTGTPGSARRTITVWGRPMNGPQPSQSWASAAEGIPLATIIPSAAPSAPSPLWLLCDGGAYAPTDYPDFFDLVGNTYGGTTAAPKLPDLRQRVPIGETTDAYKRGDMGGEATVTLTENQMPKHNHRVGTRPPGDNSGALNTVIRSYGGPEAKGSGGWMSLLFGGEWATGTHLRTENKGGGEAHNNMQPYTVVNYFIKVLP